MGTINGAETTAGTVTSVDFGWFYSSLFFLKYLSDVHQMQALKSVSWDEVVVCIVLGSHQIWEITIQSTVFPRAEQYQLDGLLQRSSCRYLQCLG